MDQPNQIHPNQGRELAEGSQYWMRESDGHVVPRELSKFGPPEPKGWVPIAVVDGRVVRDEKPLPVATSAIDAAEVNGNQIAYDQGDTLANNRRMARGRVSNPNALDDHQIRERIVARDQETATQGKPPAPEGGKQRRQRSNKSDLSGLAGQGQ
jgi:hypothetical protein